MQVPETQVSLWRKEVTAAKAWQVEDDHWKGDGNDDDGEASGSHNHESQHPCRV